MRLVAVALVCLLAASCGGEPTVDWSGVPANQRVAIEAAVGTKDCTKMQTYFDGTKNADVLDYLDWHMKRDGCYDN